MRTTLIAAGLALALTIPLAACDRAGGGHEERGEAADPAAGEKAVRAVDAELLAAFKAKDAAKAADVYAEEATVMIAGRPVDSGREAIRKTISQDLQDPNFTIEFSPSTVSVARSGDLAYTRGRFTVSFTNPQTKQKGTETGSYLTVHRKGEDGRWRIVEDITAPSPPSPAAGEGSGSAREG